MIPLGAFNPDEYLVYWLHDQSCIDLKQHGYIGCSKATRLYSRVQEHINKDHSHNSNVPKDFFIKIIFKGTQKECLEQERILRPTAHIGWNQTRGGGHKSGHMKGLTKSPEQRAKLRAAALARYARPGERERLSRDVKLGFERKGTDRSGSKNSNYGKVTSEEAKQKMRDAIEARGGVSGENNPNYRHGRYT